MAIIRYRDKDGTIKEMTVIRGKDGHTPVKGVDYFTPEDVAEIVASATEQISLVMAPVLLPQNTWYKGATDRTTITSIRIVDRYEPTGTEDENWNADTEDRGKIRCFVDGTDLIIAGNGCGRIMANRDSAYMFSGANATMLFSSVVSIEGLDLIDTRYVESLRVAFSRLTSLTAISGIENWDVSRCENYKQLVAGNTLMGGTVDLSKWNFNAANQAVLRDPSVETYVNIFVNCTNIDEIRLNKTFDLSKCSLPTPVDGSSYGSWLDEETGIVYPRVNSDWLFDVDNDHLPNPLAEGRDIAFVAVWPEAEYTV